MLLATLGLAGAVAAQGTGVVQISIGVRETGAAGQPFTNIGDNGGTSGGIEWINLDAQTLTLDGTWQQFTFDFANDPVTGFAGATANSILEGGYGTLEHIRIVNSGGNTGPFSIWVDDVENTIIVNGTPQTTLFGDFAGYANADEVMFQEPDFSGSTSGNVVAGTASGVDNFVASRTESCRFDIEFVDNTATRWVRMTTFQARSQPNPFIRFDQGSTLSFWMRGGVGQENLLSNGPGNVICEHVGTGLGNGDSSTLYIAGAAPTALGVVFINLTGGTDVPVFGGTLISLTGNLFGFPLPADNNGQASFNFPGDPNLLDLVMQPAYFDPNTPFGVAIGNAVLTRYGL